MQTRPASDFTIRQRALALLTEAPRTVAEVVAALAAEGTELGADPDEQLERVESVLESSSRFIELRAGRWFSVETLMADVVWTTELQQAELDADVLPLDPDLVVVGWWQLDQPLRAPDGSLLEEAPYGDGDDALHGPPGWLSALGEGLTSVRVERGTLRLEHLEAAPEPTDAQRDAVRAVFDRVLADDDDDDVCDDPTHDHDHDHDHDRDGQPPYVTVEDLWWEVLAAEHGAFAGAALPPLDRLLAAAGLERYHAFVGELGTDWASFDAWYERKRLASLHHLDEEQIEFAELLLATSRAFIAGEPFGANLPPEAGVGPDVLAKVLAQCLQDPQVGAALWGAHAAAGTQPEQLADYARQLLVYVSGRDAVGPRWLLARALDHSGLAVEAEAELLAAQAADVDFAPVNRALAAFAADRGDAGRALTLLHRAEVDGEDPLLTEVARYTAARPRANVGRNDPCPCGSGRKFKQCHQGRQQIALEDRAPWLFDKAHRFVTDNRFRVVAAEVATVIRSASGRDGAFLMSLLDSQLVADVVLAEGGVFETFLTERDALLPDDEVLLGGRWALVERSVFEVEGVEGDDLLLRDLRTGDRLRATNRAGAARTTVGSMFIGRPLPVGDGWRIFGSFVSMSPHLVDDALAVLDDGDMYDVAELIGLCLTEPIIRNSDGEAIIFHELVYRLADPVAGRAALAGCEELEETGDDEFALVRDGGGLQDAVIVTLRLEGDVLRVSANSDARADEARALLARVVPDAVLIDADLRDLDELLAADPSKVGATAAADGGGAANDPALLRLLDEHLRGMEQRWLDESIPALGGRTPRQAAADPIGRTELERLLNSFDRGEHKPGTMNIGRLRAALGL